MSLRASRATRVVALRSFLALASLFAVVAPLGCNSGHRGPRTSPAPVGSQLALVTTALGPGRVGVAYASTLVATGGTPPYRFVATAGLPPGLALSSTGGLTGTPTQAGAFTLAVTVSDAATPSSSTIATTVSLTIATAPIPAPAGAWTASAGRMSVGRAGHAAVLLPSGQVLVTGGWTTVGGIIPGSPTDTAELYDPATGRFTPTGRMVRARAIHQAVALPTGEVLVSGGEALGGAAIGEPELYDVARGTFSALPSWAYTSPPLARRGGTATLVGDANYFMVLFFGGTGANGTPLIQAEYFWGGLTVLPPIGWANQPISPGIDGHAAVALPGSRNVLLVGGQYGNPTPNFSLMALEVEPPSLLGHGVIVRTDIDSTGLFDRARHTATLLDSGDVLIVSGVPTGPSIGTPLVDAAVWSTRPGRSPFRATTGAPLRGRSSHTASSLAGARVLIAGGWDDQLPPAPLAECEVFSEATGAFVPAAPLGTARVMHTATRLPNGSVLVIGGAPLQPPGGSLDDAELFTP